MSLPTSPVLPPRLDMRRAIRTWWPLAASWALMGIELPALSAVVARLPNPDINLAAYGGVVFPISLIIESPIIMLLAASTALSRDWASYAKLHRFMMRAGAILTLAHVLVAFTPLYDVVVKGILGAPAEIVEPARIGLRIMTPWTWSIAYRRFHQGVLIRFDQSRAVGVGTLVRLSANFIALAVGYWLGNVPGIVVATSAVACGVVSEAIYAGLRVQPVLRSELRLAVPVEPQLTWSDFITFYIPLVMTSLLTLLAQPIGSAALSRMPLPIESLAVWPVISGLVFLLRSFGIAYNEVVVALLDEPGAIRVLRRFAGWLVFALSAFLLLTVATPLADLWFSRLSALPPHLSVLARRAVWLSLPLPTLAVLQSWYQGAILHSRRTRAITEAVVIYLLANSLTLGVGVVWGQVTGVYVGLAAMSISMLLQTGLLWWRSRSVMRAIEARDAQRDSLPLQPAETLAR